MDNDAKGGAAVNTKQNQRKQVSKDKIEKAFLTLIHTKPLNKITIQSLCTLAQVNRTTFYAHYAEIYVLTETIQNGFQQEIRLILKPLDRQTYANIESIFAQLFEFIQSHRDFYGIYLTDHQYFTPPDAPIMPAPSGQFYVDDERHYHLQFFMAGFGAVAREWLRNDCQETPQKMAALICDEYRR